MINSNIEQIKRNNEIINSNINQIKINIDQIKDLRAKKDKGNNKTKLYFKNKLFFIII